MSFDTAAAAAAAPLPNEPPNTEPALLPQTTQPAEYPDVDAFDYGDEDYGDDEDDEDDDDDDYSSDDGAGATPATHYADLNAASIYREIPLDFLTNITLQQTRQPYSTTSHLPTPPPTPTASTAPFLTPQQHSSLRLVRTLRGPLPRTYDHIDVRSRQYVPAPRFQYRMRVDGAAPLEEMLNDLAVLYLIYPEHVALFTLMAQTFRRAAAGGGGGAHMVRAMNALPHLRYLVGLCRMCFGIGVGGNLCCGRVIPL